jgi:hypothetical protein
MCVNRGREEEKEGRQRERRQRVLSVFIHWCYQEDPTFMTSSNPNYLPNAPSLNIIT